MLALGRILALALALAVGCGTVGPAPDPSKPYPSAMAQVEPLRQSGVTWSNADVRAHYLKLVSAIAPANEQWKREGVPAVERARRAFGMRRDARLLTRAMMSDPREVEALRRRDQEKYGDPDGPTFEQLVEHEQKKGRAGDAVFEAIVESAQKTDRVVNEALGVR